MSNTPPGDRDPGEISRILAQLQGGDRSVETELFSLVYSELRRIASRHMRRERAGHTLQTTALRPTVSFRA